MRMMGCTPNYHACMHCAMLAQSSPICQPPEQKAVLQHAEFLASARKESCNARDGYSHFQPPEQKTLHCSMPNYWRLPDKYAIRMMGCTPNYHACIVQCCHNHLHFFNRLRKRLCSSACQILGVCQKKSAMRMMGTPNYHACIMQCWRNHLQFVNRLSKRPYSAECQILGVCQKKSCNAHDG